MKIINSEIVFSNLFDQKRSFFSGIRSETWFFKTYYKKTYFSTVFRIFCPVINSKKFKNITFRLNSTRAIDWCMNWNIWIRKNFRHFLWLRVPLLVPKFLPKFFHNQIWQFIHQSIALFEFIFWYFDISKYFLDYNSLSNNRPKNHFWLYGPIEGPRRVVMGQNIFFCNYLALTSIFYIKVYSPANC